MNIEKCVFNGIPECLKLSDSGIELYVTTSFGPRIIGAGFAGGQNFMRVFEEQIANVSKNEWQSFGGHRFWTAPEVYPRTYFIDNFPFHWSFLDDVLVLDSPEEKENGVKKQIRISMKEGKVCLQHILTNTGRWEIEIAAWGISVMAPGGKAFIPQQKFVPAGIGEGHALLPSHPVAIWPYTDMSDDRLNWGRRFIELSESGSCPDPLKIGMFNANGYAAYELNGEYFVKHFAAFDNCSYPDFGCNCEFYTEKGMLEIESLSPLVLLAPGESINHTEEWEFFRSKPDFMQ